MKRTTNFSEQLVESRVIGLQIYDDFTFDNNIGKGHSTSAGRSNTAGFGMFGDSLKEALQNAAVYSGGLSEDGPMVKAVSVKDFMAMQGIIATVPEIKNYTIFSPYGGTGAHLFLHGRDLFTEEKAQQFFIQGNHDIAHINEEVIARVQQLFLPESLESRMANYSLVCTKDNPVALMELMLETLKLRYPTIDFSQLPEPSPDNFFSFASTMGTVLEENGINMAKMLQEAQSNPRQYLPLTKAKMLKEMPDRLAAFLVDGTADEVRQKWGVELTTYMQQKGWDWEILENFKTAISSGSKNGDTLENILEAGARIRAEQAVIKLAESIHNPYDPRFIALEESMAKTVVGSIQPMVLRKCLEDQTPIIIVGDNNLSGVEPFGQMLASFQGKYQSNPFGEGFSDFILVSHPELDLAEIKRLVRHEAEHKIDLTLGQLFSLKFDDKIPQMIEGDSASVRSLQQFIEGVTESSSLEDRQRLLILGRKRHQNIQAGAITTDIEQIKEELLLDLGHISTRLAVFAPELGEGFVPRSDVYTQQFNQRLEIPAILEELKGSYGRVFMGEVVPNLAKATDNSRMDNLLRGGEQPSWRR